MLEAPLVVETQGSIRPETLEIVRVSKIPAIASDGEDRILAANSAAEELLGYDSDRMAGRGLAQVFQPLSVLDRPLSYEGCLFRHFVKDGSASRHFECSLRKACGDYQRMTFTVAVVLDERPSSCELVYLFWPVLERRQADAAIERLLDDTLGGERGGGEAMRNGATERGVLTCRQVEVLGLIASGLSTEAVADRLRISPETVRNHVRNILSRLSAHSRAEAVSIGHRKQII